MKRLSGFLCISIMQIVLVQLLSFPSYAQNRLHNSSFEQRDTGEDSRPDDVSQVHFLKNWEDRRPKTDNAVPWGVHSPDYYSSENNFLQMYSGTQLVAAHSGNCFVGMWPCELIEQRIFDGDELANNAPFTLTLYIRVIGSLTNSLNQHWENSWDSPTVLKAYVSKEKVRYKHTGDDCSLWSDYCCEHEGGIWQPNQSIHEVASFSISKTLYPEGQWYKLTATFNSPGESYNWLSLELQSDDNVDNSSYIAIDDVSLDPGCAPSCSRTVGPINAYVPSDHHYPTTPWRIAGLENVTLFTMHIEDEAYNNPIADISIYCPNGIQHSLYFKGTILGGGELPAGSYHYDIVMSNDCYAKAYTGNIEKENSEVNPTQWIPSEYDYVCNNYAVPIPCCQVNGDDLNLDNMTISGPEFVAYYAAGALNIAEASGSSVTLSSNANVLFQGAGGVYIGPGFEPISGSEYTWQMAPCPSLRMANETGTNSLSDSTPHTKKKISGNLSDQETQGANVLSIMPNPTKSGTHLICDLSSKGILTLFITDMLGQLLATVVENAVLESGRYDFSFPTNNLSRGIYFCNLIIKGQDKGSVTKKDYKITKKIVVLNR